MRKVSRLVAFVLLIPSARRKTQWNLYLTRRNEICTPLNRPDFSPNLSGKRGKAFRFTNAWEQRKIKDLAANTYGGGTPSTSNPDFWEGSIPWIQSSDLSEHNLFRVRPRKFISQAAVTNSPVKIIPESSIAVITRVGVGKLAVMNFSYTTSQDFLSLSNLNTDVKFTSYQLYRRLQKDLNAVQGTSIKGITKEELLGKNIFIPGRQEQEAIGKFFSKIDSLLTLHQRQQNGGYLWLENSAKQVCFAIITASGLV